MRTIWKVMIGVTLGGLGLAVMGGKKQTRLQILKRMNALMRKERDMKKSVAQGVIAAMSDQGCKSTVAFVESWIESNKSAGEVLRREKESILVGMDRLKKTFAKKKPTEAESKLVVDGDRLMGEMDSMNATIATFLGTCMANDTHKRFLNLFDPEESPQ